MYRPPLPTARQSWIRRWKSGIAIAKCLSEQIRRYHYYHHPRFFNKTDYFLSWLDDRRVKLNQCWHGPVVRLLSTKQAASPPVLTAYTRNWLIPNTTLIIQHCRQLASSEVRVFFGMKIIIRNGQFYLFFHTLGALFYSLKNLILFCFVFVMASILYLVLMEWGVVIFEEHKLYIDGLLINRNVFLFTLSSPPAMHTESIMMV